MASKTASRSRKSNEWTWEDFRPEWAAERLERVSQELEKWNDELQTRSEAFRTRSQKRIEKSIKQVQTELRKLPAVKRAEKIRKDLGTRVEKNLDAGVDRVYERLQIARLDEVKRLERKITQLNRKLRDLEKKAAA